MSAPFFINCVNLNAKQVSMILGEFYDSYIGWYADRNGQIGSRKAVSIGKPASDRNVVNGLELIIPPIPTSFGREEYWTVVFINHELESHASKMSEIFQLTKGNIIHGVNTTYQPRAAEFGNSEQCQLRFKRGYVSFLGYKLGKFEKTDITNP